MISEAIKQLQQQQDLSEKMAGNVIDEIMLGKATDVQKAAFLMGLASKGATIAEISGAAASLRSHALQLQPQHSVLEIVGTGGDQFNTFNISTTTALVVAACGIPVAKHGNRAASSQSGSADVLEVLGVNLQASPAVSEQSLQQNGICFMFAQKYHQAMKYVAGIRKELQIPTLFNYLGPLANPAGANMQLLGVNDETLVEPLAHVLLQLGVQSGMVVHGTDGLDEVTLTGPTKVARLLNGKILNYVINPADAGLTTCQIEDLAGGTPVENAEITKAVLAGKQGPQRDVVLLNAACALQITQQNLTLQAAVKRAATAIDSGKAVQKLTDFITATNVEGGAV
ncbi:anthranilate phosphoribosyltransferase [Fructilactobacillus lindneri]|nr:anthranilate phosphoribosyltransferase [Fructilactobacillus lindneri]